jgi:glycosyltransferase involved in cell wall biosynthesis
MYGILYSRIKDVLEVIEMKVVLLAPTPPPAGGIASWAVRMQEIGSKFGWDVHIVDEKLIGKRTIFGNKNKRNLFVEVKRSIGIWRNLIKVLKDVNVKVVHCSIPSTTYAMLRELGSLIITKLYKRKLIIHYHCTLPNIVSTRVGIFVFKLLSNNSDLIIVLNSQSEEFVRKHTMTPSRLIPNFVKQTEIMDSKKIISPKVKTVVYVGGVIESKGCLDIITIAKEFEDIEFRLVGYAGENILRMERTKNVTLVGEVDRESVKKELEKADVFMFLTYFPGEGFSVALTEAMAAGLPCIVTDWAANRDMIEGKGGIIVPIRNPEAAANALRVLDSDAELRKHQSQWNVEKVKRFYSENVVASLYADVYNSILRNIAVKRVY